MLLGLDRVAMFGGGGLSAKSYVQDGLIAMWDGIENAGWGCNDQTLNNWKDLMGNVNLNTVGNISNDGLYEIFRGNCYLYGVNQLLCDAVVNNTWTIELLVQFQSYIKDNGSPSILSLGSGSRVLWLWNYPAIDIDSWDGYANMRSNGGSSALKGLGGSQSPNVFQFQPNCAMRNGVEKVALSKGNVQGDSNFFIGKLGGKQEFGCYQGKCGFIRIYNRIISAAEIAANYAVDKARFGLT